MSSSSRSMLRRRTLLRATAVAVVLVLVAQQFTHELQHLQRSLLLPSASPQASTTTQITTMIYHSTTKHGTDFVRRVTTTSRSSSTSSSRSNSPRPVLKKFDANALVAADDSATLASTPTAAPSPSSSSLSSGVDSGNSSDASGQSDGDDDDATNSSITIHYNTMEQLRTLLSHFWDFGNPIYKGMCTEIDEARMAHLVQPWQSAMQTISSDSSSTLPPLHQGVRIPKVTVHLDRGCEQMIRDSYSTGNLLELFYMLRLQAIAKQATLVLHCADAVDTKYELVIPWIFGTFRPEKEAVQGVKSERACATNKEVPIGKLYRDMQLRLRTMAVVVAGLPSHDPTHPSHEFAQRFLNGDAAFSRGFFQEGLLAQPPDYNDTASLPPLRHLVQEDSLDDVAIHMRCGDLMDSDHPEYEFLKFSAMAKVISPHTRSIGIITSPFTLKRANETAAAAAATPAPTNNDIQVREKDSSALLQYRCREVVTAFVDYLQVLHPQSRITIHNGRNETVMTSYVRLIMANQTIAGTSSTFGVFPTIASFGFGYLISPPFDQSVPRTRWMLEEFANDQDSDEEAVEKGVVIVEDNERAKVSFIQQLWQMEGADGVIAWFQS